MNDFFMCACIVSIFTNIGNFVFLFLLWFNIDHLSLTLRRDSNEILNEIHNQKGS